ncbi:MAG: uroporphyrinogen decarboxylase family protein [Anaerolineae bacterium]
MTDWSKRKRLEATVAGEPTDRTPVALWRHWPGDDQDAQALATAHRKWQQDYDWDLLKVGPASSFAITDWGVKDRWVGSLEGTREYTKRAVVRPSDWAALSPLDPTKGMLATQIEALRLVGEGVGDSVPFIATIFSPLAQAKNLAGEQTMLAHMRQAPDLFRQGMETMTETTLRYIEAAKATNISGIFYAVQHARYPLLSREEFQTWARPYDLKILEAVSDLWCNMVHIHSTEIMFDLAADYPAQFINWHDRETDVGLADGLAKIKGAASGGVSRWSLHEESPDKALAEAKGAVAETNGRRLLLGTGCVAMITTPTRNIRALRESVNGV